MPIRNLKDQISRLPEQPGVYLYVNRAGDTVYVGKARSLRDRVRSYLAAYGASPRTDALLDEAERLEVIVTDSVVEALALENHLIKQRAPKYNVLLRDDKNYPYLRLTTSEAFPKVVVARRVERDGDVYAGPFLPAAFARRAMSLTHRLFGIRSCNEVITGTRDRPCLEYDIKRCLAPCVDSVCSRETYARAVEDTRLFLGGRNDELVDDLGERMREAAEAERFEQAAQLRDAIRTIETLRDRQQKMATVRLGDRDVFGVKTGTEGACVLVFQVRTGKVVDRVELVTDTRTAGGGAAEVEVLQAAVQQFYEDQAPPPEVHLPLALEAAESIEAWLSDRAGRRVHLVVPMRGEKRGLLDLAARNAALAYDARFNEAGAANYDALDLLRVSLGLPILPRRIECFDISTIQGSDTVASMVVCEDGRMRRGEYRKYRIRGSAVGDRRSEVGAGRPGLGAREFETGGSEDIARREPGAGRPEPGAGERFLDDFAAMRQVVTRRYRKALEEGGPFPDLVLIDGGKGQLSAAYEGLRDLGLENLVAVGLAKREELLFTRDRDEPIVLPTGSPALHILQHIRDEAHRFAITFHRRARAMRDLRSELDAVRGIGPRRRKALLVRFGSVAGVRRATREELTGTVGARAADAILAHFAAAPG